MSVEAETADLIVHEGVVLTEAAAKLAALGAKNLAALLLALATDSNKLMGKTNLETLVKEGKEPIIFELKEKDLRALKQQSNKYGFLFSAVKDKGKDTIEIIARRDDVTKINHALANIGYGAKSLEDDSKNAKSRAPSMTESTVRGSGSESQTAKTATEPEKPSIISRIDAAKKQLKSGKQKGRDNDDRMRV